MPIAIDEIRKLRHRASAAVSKALDVLETIPARKWAIREWVRVVSPLGRTVAGIGFTSWLAGWLLGWQELMIVAAGCLILMVVTLAFVLSKPALLIDVVLEPGRVVAGHPSAGVVTARNVSQRHTLPLQVELPVGVGLSVFNVPSLAPGAEIEEIFIVATERRGVIPVGPATLVRADPLGLYHRETASSKAYELMVHPHTVALDPFGSGLLRDLEGLVTKDLSMSDLAFHALREYAPGDDSRYVHWRSSARAGRLLVRQFQDTRRSTLCVVVDSHRTAYESEFEFETALEVAGSLVQRACRDELSATLMAAGEFATGVVPHVLLDALSRAALQSGMSDLKSQIGHVLANGADTSFGIVISGSRRSTDELQKAARRFPAGIRVVTIRVAPNEPPAAKLSGGSSMLQLSKLIDLPVLLRSEGSL